MVSVRFRPAGRRILHKNFTEILCKLFIPAARPAILDSVILREKGGSSMMNWNWRDLDDVDDLIFTDAGWEHSER